MVKSGALVKADYDVTVDGEVIEQRKGVVIAIGKDHVVKGFDEALQGAEIGKKISVEVPPEKAYGQRDSELVKMIALETFRKQGVDPVPGMPVTLDNLPARVQSVSGGRVRVDFNHELAGKTVQYDFVINKELTTTLEKINAIVEQYTDEKDFKCSFDESSKTVGVEFTSNACQKQGYLPVKNTVLAMLLSFVEGVEKVKFVEEYVKSKDNV